MLSLSVILLIVAMLLCAYAATALPQPPKLSLFPLGVAIALLSVLVR